MTRETFKPERHTLGKIVKAYRQELGYSRKTFGQIIGYNENNSKRRMAAIEGGRKNLPDDLLQRCELWSRFGIPPDAPDPDLLAARAKYYTKLKERGPKLIKLNEQLEVMK